MVRERGLFVLEKVPLLKINSFKYQNNNRVISAVVQSNKIMRAVDIT